MNDLINRQQAIDEISRWLGYLDDDMILRIQIGLRKLPSAQTERKRGNWVTLDSDSEIYEDIKCPFCGHTFTVDVERMCDIGFIREDLKYCPNCGAKME